MPLRRPLLALVLCWAGLLLVLAGAERLRGAALRHVESSAEVEKHGPGKDVTASQHSAGVKVPAAPAIKRAPRQPPGLLSIAPRTTLLARPRSEPRALPVCSVCVRVRRHIPRLSSDDPPWLAGT